MVNTNEVVINPVNLKLLKMLNDHLWSQGNNQNGKYAALAFNSGQAETESYREIATT